MVSDLPMKIVEDPSLVIRSYDQDFHRNTEKEVASIFISKSHRMINNTTAPKKAKRD